MSQRNFSKLVQGELAALFVAGFRAALFFLGQGLFSAALLFSSVLAMAQPFLLYDHFRRQG